MIRPRARIFGMDDKEAEAHGFKRMFQERPFAPRRNCLGRLFCRLLIDNVQLTPEQDRQATELLNNSLRLQPHADEFPDSPEEPTTFGQAVFVQMPDKEMEDPKMPEEEETVPSDESEESSSDESLLIDEYIEQDIERILADE